MKSLVMILAAVSAVANAQKPIEQASEARLWLKVPSDQAPLHLVEVSKGTATPAPWEKDAALRQRLIDILFPVSWWSWTELTIRFTPEEDGLVELSLNGVWSPEKDGLMSRKEILWDDITAEGAEIINGGFESGNASPPSGWQSPWGPYPAADEWPLAKADVRSGNGLAASWCKRPLVQKLRVKGGRPVVIKLHARAATTPDFVAPKRLTGETAAHRALAPLKRGVNLGNGWEAPPPHSWGIKFTTEDIDHIADEGFDHIRVPVAWHFHLKPKDGVYEIDPDFLTEIEPVLRRALERNLHVMLNWHHFNDLTADPAAHLERFKSGWDAIARHFQSWPPELFFELLNEPCDALTTAVANPIYQDTIGIIRRSNPQRTLVVSPGHWGIIGELENLRLPDADENIIVTVHCYDPFHFTHQGAGWAGLQALSGVQYPGPPDSPLKVPDSLMDHQGVVSFIEHYNRNPGEQNPSSPRVIRNLLDTARVWSLHFGRPVHLGEFGAYQTGDKASRERYLRDVRTLAEERGIPWTLWEWKAGFGYWDPKTNQALFRKSLME